MKLFKALSAFAMILAMASLQPARAEQPIPDTLRIATDATFPPMEFVKDGKRTGFDIELIEAMAKVMGKKVQWVDIDFKGLIPGLIAGRFDVAASAIYMTEERRKVVDFTDPYYQGGLAVLVRKDSTINRPADLANRSVSVQVGTKSVNFLRDNYPSVHRVEVEKNQEMFDLLTVKRVDAAVTGRPAAVEFARVNPGVRVLDRGMSIELYGFALRKDEPQLTKRMNAALQTVRNNGVYDALVVKYFGAAH